jgi:hypothetical protein
MSMPEIEWSSGPPPKAPPARSAPTPRAERGLPPAVPLPYEPIGTPPPHGMAWPPPEGDPTVCLLKESENNGRRIITKCGRLLILQNRQDKIPHVSAWSSEVTCKRCAPDA